MSSNGINTNAPGCASASQPFFFRLSGFLADFVLISSCFFFNLSYTLFIFPVNIVVISIMLAAVILRRGRLKRNIAVRIVYFFFILFAIDVMLLMHAGIYSWRGWLAAAAPAVYIVSAIVFTCSFDRFLPAGLLAPSSISGRMIAFFRRFNLDAWTCLVFPLAITFVLSSAADSPQSKEDCSRINAQPGARLILDLRAFHGSKIRKMMFLENPPRILLTYRQGVFSDLKKHAAGITQSNPGEPPRDVVSMETAAIPSGRKTVWLRQEVIGLEQHPAGGDIYAVAISRSTNREKHVSRTDVVRFDNSGRIKSRTPVPGGMPDSYAASIFPTGGNLLIVVEGKYFIYETGRDKIRLVASDRTSLPFNMVRHGNHIYGVNVHPAVLTPFNRDSLVKFDLRKMRVVAKRYGGLFGYYDIRNIPGSDEFVVSNLWIGGGIIVDSNLERRGGVAFPNGTRKFVFAPGGRLILVPNFFTGELRALDFRSGRMRPGSVFIGRGARDIEAARGGKLLFGNSCGIVEVDPAKAGLLR